MDNPGKLATYATQNEEKQIKKHNTIYVEPYYTQTNTNNDIVERGVKHHNSKPPTPSKAINQ
jgi:hypothetical protein